MSRAPVEPVPQAIGATRVIITQTPLPRQLRRGRHGPPAFYTHEPGAVLSCGVNHHMYITVSPRFDKTTRIAYSRTEIADDVSKIEHTIARERCA